MADTLPHARGSTARAKLRCVALSRAAARPPPPLPASTHFHRATPSARFLIVSSFIPLSGFMNNTTLRTLCTFNLRFTITTVAFIVMTKTNLILKEHYLVF